MKFVIVKGEKFKVISEKLITGWIVETNKEMIAREKKLLPLEKYSYVAIKVKG